MNQKEKLTLSSRYAFIAAHRGGPLSPEDHRKLIRWAIECAEHVLQTENETVDVRLTNALDIAKKWESGAASTGEAMKASLAAHAAAREAVSPVTKAITRAIGQAVATAHMADHSLGLAYYALKAVKYSGGNTGQEKEWQLERLKALPSPVVTAVREMWQRKDLDKKI